MMRLITRSRYSGVIVAVEAVILSSFILLRQNRMMGRGERRDNLNLQVDLLAEKEITKVLQMVRAICEHGTSAHHGRSGDP